MKVLVNKYLPFKGYVAMVLFDLILIRSSWRWDNASQAYKDRVINHESIHIAQMRDFCRFILLGGLMFYIAYIFEWIYRILFTRDFMSHDAYKHISFEREAYANERDLNYTAHRVHFAQWRK